MKEALQDKMIWEYFTVA